MAMELNMDGSAHVERRKDLLNSFWKMAEKYSNTAREIG